MKTAKFLICFAVSPFIELCYSHKAKLAREFIESDLQLPQVICSHCGSQTKIWHLCFADLIFSLSMLRLDIRKQRSPPLGTNGLILTVHNSHTPHTLLSKVCILQRCWWCSWHDGWHQWTTWCCKWNCKCNLKSCWIWSRHWWGNIPKH